MLKNFSKALFFVSIIFCTNNIKSCGEKFFLEQDKAQDVNHSNSTQSNNIQTNAKETQAILAQLLAQLSELQKKTHEKMKLRKDETSR